VHLFKLVLRFNFEPIAAPSPMPRTPPPIPKKIVEEKMLKLTRPSEVAPTKAPVAFMSFIADCFYCWLKKAYNVLFDLLLELLVEVMHLVVKLQLFALFPLFFLRDQL